MEQACRGLGIRRGGCYISSDNRADSVLLGLRRVHRVVIQA